MLGESATLSLCVHEPKDRDEPDLGGVPKQLIEKILEVVAKTVHESCENEGGVL